MTFISFFILFDVAKDLLLPAFVGHKSRKHAKIDNVIKLSGYGGFELGRVRQVPLASTILSRIILKMECDRDQTFFGVQLFVEFWKKGFRTCGTKTILKNGAFIKFGIFKFKPVASISAHSVAMDANIA